MEAKEIKQDDALTVYESLAAGAVPGWDSLESPIRAMGKTIQIDIPALIEALEALKRKFPTENMKKHKSGKDFDALAAVEIHKKLPIPDVLAGNQGFWTWLSLRYFWDLINWRMGGDGKLALPSNFSVKARREGLIERLWFRAEVGKIEGSQPYKYVLEAKDTDFWTSGLIRPSYSSNRAVARAFLKYQYPNPGGRLHLTDPLGVRRLYKLLRQLYASIMLDALNEESAFTLISELGNGLKRAKS